MYIDPNFSYYFWIGLVNGAQCHFQQFFSYIEAVNFFGGGNLSARSKPLTCRKSLTDFIT
jgi:hypothetical protein